VAAKRKVIIAAVIISALAGCGISSNQAPGRGPLFRYRLSNVGLLRNILDIQHRPLFWGQPKVSNDQSLILGMTLQQGIFNY
jgi:hypothetical protein